MSTHPPQGACYLVCETHDSTPNVDPFEDFEWEFRSANDGPNNVTFRQDLAKVQRDWSNPAAKIVVSKYIWGDISRGANPKTGGRERSQSQLFQGVTRTIPSLYSALRIRLTFSNSRQQEKHFPSNK